MVGLSVLPLSRWPKEGHDTSFQPIPSHRSGRHLRMYFSHSPCLCSFRLTARIASWMGQSTNSCPLSDVSANSFRRRAPFCMLPTRILPLFRPPLFFFLLGDPIPTVIHTTFLTLDETLQPYYMWACLSILFPLHWAFRPFFEAGVPPPPHSRSFYQAFLTEFGVAAFSVVFRWLSRPSPPPYEQSL